MVRKAALARSGAIGLDSGDFPAIEARFQGVGRARCGGGATPFLLLAGHADVAELVDALDLGSSGATRGGSIPLIRTRLFLLGYAWRARIGIVLEADEVCGNEMH